MKHALWVDHGDINLVKVVLLTTEIVKQVTRANWYKTQCHFCIKFGKLIFNLASMRPILYCRVNTPLQFCHFRKNIYHFKFSTKIHLLTLCSTGMFPLMLLDVVFVSKYIIRELSLALILYPIHSKWKPWYLLVLVYTITYLVCPILAFC